MTTARSRRSPCRGNVQNMAPKSKPTPVSDKEVKAAISIEPMAIQEEYCRVPGDLRHYKNLLAEAQMVQDQFELDVERVEGELWEKFRKLSAPGKKDNDDYRTRDETKMAVRGDSARVKAVGRVIAAKEAVAKAWAIVDAVRAKEGMVQSLGADLREDRAGSRGRPNG